MTTLAPDRSAPAGLDGADYIVYKFRLGDIARTEQNREWRETKSIKIAKAFDLVRAILAGFVVGMRTYPSDKVFVWLDGQHRGEAAKMAGLEDTEIDAFLIEVGSPDQEAEWILKLNEDRSPNSGLDELRLGLRADRAEIIGAVELIKRYGYVLDGEARPGHIAAIKKVLSIFARRNGADQLDRIMLCANTIATGNETIEGTIFTGLDYFWKRHPECKPSDAARWFSKAGNVTWYMNRAKGMPGRITENIYILFVGAWNNSSGTKLAPKGK